MITRIDHIGIAVQNINDALAFFQDALGVRLDRVESEEGGRTKVAFLPVGTSDVELVEPQDADSGLAKFLAKRGEGVHHICFEVDDIDAALTRLKEKGAQLIDETPRVNAKGMRYAFIHPTSAHGVLIELYQKPTKDGGRKTKA
jgi:methylmalonyl-CoA epimerase